MVGLPLEVPRTAPTLVGETVTLRALTDEDVGETYVGWMNDSEVVKYTESRFATYTLARVRSYVQSIVDDRSSLIWAICETGGGRHVGNIKLGPIDWHHRFGDVGLLIGQRSVWGRGYATEAISLLADYSFATLELHKLTSGAYAENVGSRKAFDRAGFQVEGVRRSQYLTEDRYTDVVLYGRINGEEA